VEGENVPRAATYAKELPRRAIVVTVLAVTAGLLLGWFEAPRNRAWTSLLCLGGLGVALSYQGLYVLARPDVASEHGIEPPAKFDVEYETTAGARIVGTLSLSVGLVATFLGLLLFFAMG
jgi:hypothetical protein